MQEKREAPCCCGAPGSEPGPSNSGEAKPPRWASGALQAGNEAVPIVKTSLDLYDKLGNWRVRWHVGRMAHFVSPGLYAAGSPGSDSPVLVTANYKMSFDRLRSVLAGRCAWILVVDTKGINVWCAAGKGTFSAEEVARQVEAAGLSKIVSHRALVLPQLAGPGVSAPEVKRLTGFRVIYGPVLAKDLPAFLDAGMEAAPEMRRVRFGLFERAVLVPVEAVEALKYAFPLALFFGLLAGLSPSFYSPARALSEGPLFAAMILAAVIASATLVPLLLPWLPGRAFSLKGLWVGMALSLWPCLLSLQRPEAMGGWLGLAGWCLLLCALSSFTAMNFTGASTFTSQSGVLKEMRAAVPAQALSAILGLALVTTGRFA